MRQKKIDRWEFIASGLGAGTMALGLGLELGPARIQARESAPMATMSLKKSTYADRRTALFFCCGWILLAILLLGSVPASGKIRTCGPIYLRDADGRIINPMTGENADQPFSTRQTCGACHDYERITLGYHFQQGWDRVRDDFSKEKPWALSDGMLGKQ